MLTSILHLAFPQSCLLCAGPDSGRPGICRPCLQDLPWHLHDTCPQCVLPSQHNLLCGQCISHPPAFDATFSLFRYQFPLSGLLQQFKYRQLLTLAHTMGNLLVEHMPRKPVADCLIPMPLHQKRLQERGFNQSMEIAKVVSAHLHIPVDFRACKRVRPTPPQASLPYKQRIRNMQGAFECLTTLQDMNVVLIDDVMTTGASLNALAKTVKAAGAKHVECWVIARTCAQ